ncbi:MAG: Gldg family protein [Myxococcales bacterium]|nr:Gldg family protein [Myxococcales bacterium]
MRGPSYLVSLCLAAGLLLAFLGERVVNPGTTRLVLDGIGLALLVLALSLRTVRLRSAEGERKAVERALLGLGITALASLAIYFAQSDLLAKLDGRSLAQDWPKLSGALGALWPALMAGSLLPSALMELSYAAMARAPQVESGRVRDAMLSGLALAAVLVLVFSIVFVASERDHKWDLSYARAAKPGEATRRIVAALDEPVSAALFFPPANEVAEQVKAYFDELRKESPKLSVESYDHALDPGKAKELAVSGNGVVVLAKGSRREQLFVGQELEKARTNLRSLDQDVQKRLLVVARSRKTIYLTAGHGERAESPSSSTDQRATVRLLREELRAQNYELRSLSVAEGLGSEVPKDAAAVLVLGPQSGLLPGEGEALKAYFERGGRLLLALDPEAGLDFKELLSPLGLTFTPQQLASDVAHARKAFQPSDRTIIGTNSYSSHPSVTANGRMGNPMYLMGAGALEELAGRPTELAVDFSVRAHHSTWNDKNGNFNHDPPEETRKSWAVAAAVTRRPKGSARPEEEGRAIVLADSDALADEVLTSARVRGNPEFALDGLKWLLGDEAIAGATNTEQDVPLTRTRTQDVAWFFSTVFIAPAVVLTAGLLVRRRGRPSASPKGGTP